jgi:hypothetical protein
LVDYVAEVGVPCALVTMWAMSFTRELILTCGFWVGVVAFAMCKWGMFFLGPRIRLIHDVQNV